MQIIDISQFYHAHVRVQAYHGLDRSSSGAMALSLDIRHSKWFTYFAVWETLMRQDEIALRVIIVINLHLQPINQCLKYRNQKLFKMSSPRPKFKTLTKLWEPENEVKAEYK